MAQAENQNNTTDELDPYSDDLPFGITSNMENAVIDVGRAESAIRLLACAQDLDEEQIGDTLYLIADCLERSHADLRERQGKLFHLLHPRREEFERTGWPEDQAADKSGGV